ncbi:type II toxin-antitoxin system RelE/ParE family toxin [Aggregatimonas sangjinii]|uniref:Type II toxin-antitoxin system RelE/ParE family toxin n=1 Tax=Aggregatimonas sangjinii TaxID=2583587 RepID=A0A5B7SPS1_9FLAO|nr:type II toxin-antitoxin system RelE/ParE family toxin [Aggregatimonas sangjinii]QCW98992.1 type II toxin-antitoxin system RelE/ParE family toxin [Aggregatimonas sangjinii]
MVRKIKAYKNYFVDFYESQEVKVQNKIEYVLDLVRFEKRVPKKFFKALENTDGIYEVRVITTFKSIRILCFFDDGNLIMLVNCFIKKTQKTPKKEIKLAEKLKKEYLKNKNG